MVRLLPVNSNTSPRTVRSQWHSPTGSVNPLPLLYTLSRWRRIQIIRAHVFHLTLKWFQVSEDLFKFQVSHLQLCISEAHSVIHSSCRNFKHGCTILNFYFVVGFCLFCFCLFLGSMHLGRVPWCMSFFFPVFLGNNWHTSLYNTKWYSMNIWFTYIVKWSPC